MKQRVVQQHAKICTCQPAQTPMLKQHSQRPLAERPTMLGSQQMMRLSPQISQPPSTTAQLPRTPLHRNTRSGAKAAKHQQPMRQRSSRQPLSSS
jgi:hypothetical protein